MATLAVGIGTTVVASSLLFFGVLPPEIALTDVGLGVLASSLAVAVFRYRLLDFPSVGRQQFVEGMEDPLVFVDDADEVAHSNPTARPLSDSTYVALPLSSTASVVSHTGGVSFDN